MKKFFISTFILIGLSVAFTTYAEDIISENDNDMAIMYSVNNLYNNIDYKTLATVTDAEADLLGMDTNQWVDCIPNKNLSESTVEESWLIRNDIISRPFILNNNDVLIKDYKAEDFCPKTLLYTMLYKSYHGVLDSRRVVFNECNRFNGPDDNSTPVYDKAIFCSSNVYELYLKELLDAQIISIDDFNDKNGARFLQDYENLCNNNVIDADVPWSNQIILTDSSQINALGYSYNYMQGDIVFGINEEQPNYFVEEKLYTKDALNIISDYVRKSEKDMSQLESSVIAYKYGLNYLRNISEADRKSIEFLIAKGILDFEHPSEFINLYGEFTYGDACKLLYRVANPEARLNFSEIKLTDGDTFWMDKGFLKDNLQINIVSELPVAETITEEYWAELIKNNKDYITPNSDNNSKPVNDTFINDLLGMLNVKTAYAETMTQYKVIKMFNTAYGYNYRGIPIEDLEKSEDRPSEFVSYERQTINSLIPGSNTGNSVIMAKVTFSVEAKDYDTAVLYVDNNITIDNAVNNPDIDCFTILEEDGNEITLIPASAIRAANLDIDIIEDKVLVNNITGVSAILLPENGYALVGNRIIRSSNLIVTDTSNEVYYNLDVICTLLGNVSLEHLARGNTLYVCDSIINEVAVDTYSSAGSLLGKSYVVAVDISDMEQNSSANDESIGCFNIDNLEIGVNSLSRKFSIDINNKVSDVYVIVDYDYVLPDDEVLADSQYAEFINNLVKSSDSVTLQNINDIIYTRPVGSDKLQDWWDSNISVGNALANFMYGTTGVEYVKSGYLVPNLTILRNSDISDADISSMFTKNGFKLDSVGLHYCNSTTKWWETYYSGSTMSDDYLKALAFSNRKCSIMNSNPVSDGNIYDNTYFVTKAGVIYKNVRMDDNVYYKNNRIELTTRRVDGRARILPGNTFSYAGKRWLYKGTYNKNGHIYYGVQPLFDDDSRFPLVAVSNIGSKGIIPIFSNGDLNSSSNSIWVSAVNQMNALYDTYFGYQNYLFGGLGNPIVSDGVSRYLPVNTSTDMYVADNSDILTHFKDIYGSVFYVNGDVLSNGQVSDTIPSRTPQSVHGNHDIVAVPIFYISTDDFYFYGEEGSFYMNKGPLVKALNVNGIFTVGVSKCVRDSIIYRATKTMEINKLIENQTVIISDISFKRVASSNAGSPIFVSEPIENTELVNSLLQAGSPSDYLNIVKNNIFAGIQVNYGNKNVYLSSFIKNAFIGELYNPNQASGVLYSNNGRSGGALRVYLDDGAPSQDATVTSATSVCIAIQLEDGLFARPTTSKQNTYVALLYSPVTIDSSVDDIPFFNEPLAYSDSDPENVTVENSYFYPSELFKMAKSNFKKLNAKAFRGDIITTIWMLLFYLTAYMAIMSWVMYAVLTKGYAYKIFEVLTIPSNNGKRSGFDLVKLLTFGIYNINSEPTLARTFVSSFIYFFISYAIVIWQPF